MLRLCLPILSFCGSKPDGITLIVKTALKPYLCPQCHQPSTHLHTHNQDNGAETLMMAFLSVA